MAFVSEIQFNIVYGGNVIVLYFQNLMKHCKPEERRSLMSGFRMLTEPQQMGHKFKFLAFYPAVVKDFIMKFPPAGFYRNLD